MRRNTYKMRVFGESQAKTEEWASGFLGTKQTFNCTNLNYTSECEALYTVQLV